MAPSCSFVRSFANALDDAPDNISGSYRTCYECRYRRLDEAMNILLIRTSSKEMTELGLTLSRLDHSVITVTSYKNTLKALDENPDLDLIISECMLGKENGFSILERIKFSQKYQWIPVIMASKTWTTENALRSHQLGALDILALPMKQETLEAKLKLVESSGRPRVLVVDDEKSIRELLADLLSAQRVAVVEADKGDTALAKIEKQHVDIVVTDIVMPGMNGIELMKRIKAKHSDIPVILITGNSGKYSPDMAMKEGADGYFAKPFHNVDLMFTLRKALNSRRAARKAAAEA